MTLGRVGRVAERVAGRVERVAATQRNIVHALKYIGFPLRCVDRCVAATLLTLPATLPATLPTLYKRFLVLRCVAATLSTLPATLPATLSATLPTLYII